MKIYNQIWVILLEAFDGNKSNISEILKLNQAISTIISHHSLIRVNQLYELLTNSLIEFFDDLKTSFNEIPSNKLYGSYLSLTKSIETMVKMINVIFYPIYSIMPMLRLQSFKDFPTPSQLYYYLFKKHFFNSLKDKLNDSLEKEFKKFMMRKFEQRIPIENKLKIYYDMYWKMVMSNNYIVEENENEKEIEDYINIVLKYNKEPIAKISLVIDFLDVTCDQSIREEVEKKLFTIIYGTIVKRKSGENSLHTSLELKESMTEEEKQKLEEEEKERQKQIEMDEKNVSMFSTSFEKEFEFVKHTFEANKVIGKERMYTDKLKIIFKEYIEKQENKIIDFYIQIGQFLQKNYNGIDEFDQALKSSCNSLLSMGFGTNIICQQMLDTTSPLNSVAYELYNLCELKESLRTTLLNHISVELVNSEKVTDKLLEQPVIKNDTSIQMKVKKMIRDKEESQKISENFMKSKYYQCLNSSLKVNVLIATQHVWPLTHTSIPVLECLKPTIVMFVGFYHRYHPQTMIKFLHKHSTYEILFEGSKETYTVNHMQAMIMIDAVEGKLNIEEMKKIIPTTEKIIEYLKENQVMNDQNQIIPTNNHIDISLMRFVKKQDEKKQIVQQSKFFYEAKLVKIMKRIKTASKSHLMECLKAEVGNFDMKMVNETLVSLINKDYLEYSSENDMYEYLA